MPAAKRSAGVATEVNLNSSQAGHKTRKRGIRSGFETQGRYHQKSKTKVSVHPQEHPEETPKNSDICDTIKRFWFCFIMVVYEILIFLIVGQNLGNVWQKYNWINIFYTREIRTTLAFFNFHQGWLWYSQIFLGNLRLRSFPVGDITTFSRIAQKDPWISQSSLVKIEKSQRGSDLPSVKYINPIIFLSHISQISVHN